MVYKIKEFLHIQGVNRDKFFSNSVPISSVILFLCQTCFCVYVEAPHGVSNGNLPVTAVFATFFYRHCLTVKAAVNQMVKLPKQTVFTRNGKHKVYLPQ